ncbi:MAG: iron-sulfur cluster assembly accessory protein [Synechococcaceae bacterium WB8_1B_057]|nr:iron-sulfur cluster assembly accessory protein [Synechococcaceae bacterium WB6_1A_059]NDG79408.1 iron-sulfur cluster assembly accessory protein [Synechococcaceae bacterium WB8_1B_057]
MVSISEVAAAKVQQYLTKRGKGLGIKIGVKTTGCSGLAYVLEFIDKLDETLAVYVSNKTMIFIDPKHLPYLTGIEIDWVKQGLNEGFEFRNPQEKHRCGCGESFNV